jgi:hypothetical protein
VSRERKYRIEAFKNQEVRALVNNVILTTGFDHGPIDMIGDLAATTSPGRHVQKLGRGTRPAPGKENCIAEGELVLTGRGLVPIEKVTLDMKLWDGYNWVNHCGTIFHGKQEVITYAGLTATKDHKVWTEKGWATFGRCASEQIPISQTGTFEQEIRETDGHFIGNFQERESQQTLFKSKMRLWFGIVKRRYQCIKKSSWLSNLRTPSTGSQMVKQSDNFSKTKMHESKRSCIRKIWRERHRVQIRKSVGDGSLCSKRVRFRSIKRNRPNRQQRSLRTWEFAAFNTGSKFSEHKTAKNRSFTTCFQKITSTSKIRGRHIKKLLFKRNDFRTNNSQMVQSEIMQTERKVWDILNAGPLHRFTVSNLLVSNCLVLDFAGNVKRLGPINDPVLPKKKGKKVGEAPIRICPQCGVYNHASARICFNCQFEFPIKEKLTKKAGTAEIIKSNKKAPEPMKVKVFTVSKAIYKKHHKAGSKPTLQVTYFSSGGTFKEFVCLEHKGYARTMAITWWKLRHNTHAPLTINQSLDIVSFLKVPKSIRVWTNKKYPEVMSYEW